jgi:hypothetical protein
MLRKLTYFIFIVLTYASCCAPTKTYDSFTQEQEKLLRYLYGQSMVYDLNTGDSVSLNVTEQYIGNLPPEEGVAVECDSDYPAYGKAKITSYKDSSLVFIISIKKSLDADGITMRVRWMNYDINLDDSASVIYHDSLNLRHPNTFNNVYELFVPDTTNTRPDLIHKIYFSTEYGVIRFDRKDGRTYRLRI